MKRNVYERNYARIEALLGLPLAEMQADRVYRLCSDSFMDLVVEVVLPECEETGAMVISMAHYFKQHGDLCQDPEMTVRIFPADEGLGQAEALTFQQAIPPIYHVVYPAPGKVYPQLKRELNAFLTGWLIRLKQQRHRLVVS